MTLVHVHRIARVNVPSAVSCRFALEVTLPSVSVCRHKIGGYQIISYEVAFFTVHVLPEEVMFLDLTGVRCKDP